MKIGFGFGFSSFHSHALSLTRFVYVDEEGGYNSSINKMKEMEKRGTIFFSIGKRLSLFIH